MATAKTDYKIYTENGQKRYGPPDDWQGPIPVGSEVFIGKIPHEVSEIELIQLFEKYGQIYTFRLMLEFASSASRGFGFCLYATKEEAKRAIAKLNNYEIRTDRKIGVCLSVDNCRLFVGGIPKSKNKQEILEEMKKITENVRDVIVYPSAADKTKNRGFAFVEYDCHKSAAAARKKLIPAKVELWDQQIAVDWAEPEKMVDDDVMSKVKIVYVRNLMLTTTEEHLRDLFTKSSGSTEEEEIERVKKIKDYAFIHFKHRDIAQKAIDKLNGTDCEGSVIEVSWAKPADKSEPRYTRGGGRNVSVQYTNAFNGTFMVDPVVQNNILNYGLRSRAGTLPAMVQPIKTYRNAAGSRAAGSRSHSVTRLPHSMSGVHPVETLTELCQSMGLGLPSYDIQNQQIYDPTVGFRILPVCQVLIPGLNRAFFNRDPCMKAEDARANAAQVAVEFLTLCTGYPLWQTPYRGLSIGEAFEPRQFRNTLVQNPEFEPKKPTSSELTDPTISSTTSTTASQFIQSTNYRAPPGFATAGIQQDKVIIGNMMNRMTLGYVGPDRVYH